MTTSRTPSNTLVPQCHRSRPLRAMLILSIAFSVGCRDNGASLDPEALDQDSVVSVADPGRAQLPRRELVFSRHSDSARKDFDIWRMCGDGTQLASLLVLPGNQIHLSVAPDGDSLLFASKEGDQWEVWSKGFDSGEPVNLTRHTASDRSPDWSPRADRIAFTSDREGERGDIYLMNPDGSGVERLTTDPRGELDPSWDPTGSTIVFTRYTRAPEADGGEDDDQDDDHDFMGGRIENGIGDGFSINVASGEERQLTDFGSGSSGGFSYSPDGKTIAFHRVADERSEIWLMDSDGSNQRAITDTKSLDEYTPAFSLDGRWIAYSAGSGSGDQGRFDLWIMGVDGRDRQMLNSAPNTEAWHVWRSGDHLCR